CQRTTARRSTTNSPRRGDARSPPRPRSSAATRPPSSRCFAPPKRKELLMLPVGVRKLFRVPLGRRAVEHDIDAELRFHIDMRTADLMRGGLSREAAIRQTQTEFGDLREARRELTAIGRRREGHRARMEWWHDTVQDARIAARSFRIVATLWHYRERCVNVRSSGVRPRARYGHCRVSAG